MNGYTTTEILAKASDCMDDAKDLLSGDRYDAALNRAYYTMFHCIQALLSTKLIVTKSHKGAHNSFHREFILTQLFPKKLGLALKQTFEKRQFSDYDYDEVLQEDAKESVEDAAHFFEATILYLKQNNFLQ